MASVEQLQQYYEARCASAAIQGSSLILSIPCGLSADCVSINLELTRQAMLCKDSAFHCNALDRLFLNTKLVLAPAMEAYALEEERDMSARERIMRHGYGRDRVIACNRVKQSILNQDKVGVMPEYVDKQKQNILFVQEWFKQAEAELESLTALSDPSDVARIKRSQWARELDVDPDALQNQITLLQATRLQGLTLLQMEALATDTRLSDEATFRVAAEEMVQERVEARDRLIGTETFVSFTFPPVEHSLLVAAAANEGGILKSQTNVAHPAHVTFHPPTGEVTSLALASGQTIAPNSLFVGDAAELLARLHALTREAGRGGLLMEHWSSS